MNLQVIRRDVYGRSTFYPVNKEARYLAEIAGTKTLKPETIALAVKGFAATIEVLHTSAPLRDIELLHTSEVSL